MADIELDAIYWYTTNDGDYAPLLEPLSLIASNPPVITSFTPQNNQITLQITAPTSSSFIVVRYRRMLMENWNTLNLSISRTGSGTLVIPNLLNYETYEVSAYVLDQTTNVTSAWAKPIYTIPRPTTASKVTVCVVDQTAYAILNAIKNSGLGKIITFTNYDSDPIDIWAVESSQRVDTIDVKGANVGLCEISYTVPKQTGFPPVKIYPGAIIQDSESLKNYQVISVEYSRTNMLDSPTLDLRCNILNDVTCI